MTDPHILRLQAALPGAKKSEQMARSKRACNGQMLKRARPPTMPQAVILEAKQSLKSPSENGFLLHLHDNHIPANTGVHCKLFQV